MNHEHTIVIGGGLAGLTTGIYLLRNGCRVTICERAGNSGGVSVSWKRAGYTFDGATNWVPGSTPALNFHATLAEVLDFSRFEWIDFDVFQTMHHPDGETVTVYKNADLLERELLRVSPADAKPVRALMRAVRQVTRVSIPVAKPFDLYTPLDWLGMPFSNPHLIGLALQWRRCTIEQFTRRLSSERLRWFIDHILPHHTQFSVLALITSLGWLCMRAAGYPVGGSAKLASELEMRFRSEGGEIRFGCDVTRILVENHRACGVELDSGEQLTGDGVFSAADSHRTIHELLAGRYTHPAHEKAFASWPVFPSMLQISYGIARPLDEAVNKMIIALPTPLPMGSDSATEVIVRVCSFDPTFAPRGCSALIANLRTSDWEYWTTLRRDDPQGYRTKKRALADQVLATLENYLGPLTRHCDVVDVATPATYIRYNSIWQGSYQGWFPSPAVIGKALPMTLQGLERFYLTGQWVVPPGGIARVMVAARHAVQIWCRDTARAFTPQATHTGYEGACTTP